MNLLLTGATGYLGSNLAHAFYKEGHKLISIKRRCSNLKRIKNIADNVIFYDIEDTDLVRPFIDQGPIDVIIHTAADYGRGGQSITKIHEVNTTLPLRLLETAIYYKVPKFINTDTILHPFLNPYALTKKQFCDLGRLIASTKISFVNVRLEHFYGPGDDISKFTTWIVKRCLLNDPIIELTGGEQLRDFIYIDDVVSAFCIMIKNHSFIQTGFHELDLGSGNPIRLRSFVEIVHQLTNSQSHLAFGALEYREHELMKSHARTHQLRDLGWECKTSLTKGISKMIQSEKIMAIISY